MTFPRKLTLAGLTVLAGASLSAAGSQATATHPARPAAAAHITLLDESRTEIPFSRPAAVPLRPLALTDVLRAARLMNEPRDTWPFTRTVG